MANLKLKNIARYVLFLLNKKKYNIKLENNAIITCLRKEQDKEYFYGYYDKCPEHNGHILFHEMQDDGKAVRIIVKCIATRKEKVIAKTQSFNWQIGARSIWINDDIVSYNDFDGKKYICKWYSLSEEKCIRIFDYALLDNYKQEYFLGINFQRLKSYAKEYAYNCLPQLEDKNFKDYSHDGIWKIDIPTQKRNLLISITDVLKCQCTPDFDNAYHFLNHIMISPSGKSFIFIHRYYKNNIRYDRLMYYDFNSLKCLLDDKTQSHFCWIDDSHVFGYGEYKKILGFYTINVKTLSVEYHDQLTLIHPKDGHPTYYNKWIVIDSYPDLSRMQSLIAYNIETHKIIKIGEFFHDLKHKGITRCDLHPRFSGDGKSIYIDTIYSGSRQLCKIDLNGLLS